MIALSSVVASLGALAQEHRLAIFRMLVQAGDAGLAAGSIAERLSVPPSSLSFHLAHLNRVALIEQRRSGRMLIYRANYSVINGLIDYLTENCCGGADCSSASATTETEDAA